MTDVLSVRTDERSMTLARQMADPPEGAQILGLVGSAEDPIRPRLHAALVRFRSGAYGTMFGVTWRSLHPRRVPEHIRAEHLSR